MIDLAKVAGFEWDAGNSRKNEKHGVSAGEAEQVFYSKPLLVFADEKHSGLEARFQAMGKTDEGRLLHVTFTMRRNGEYIRVISARDMHRKERKTYEQRA